MKNDNKRQENNLYKHVIKKLNEQTIQQIPFKTKRAEYELIISFYGYNVEFHTPGYEYGNQEMHTPYYELPNTVGKSEFIELALQQIKKMITSLEQKI